MKFHQSTEELQSRRQFFKAAAKAALPVIGAMVFANIPIQQVKATTGCDGGCYYSCYGNCKGYCEGSCSSCNGRCASDCQNTCTGGCTRTCSGACTSSNYY